MQDLLLQTNWDAWIDWIFVFASFFTFLAISHFKSVILVVRFNLAFVFAFLFAKYLSSTDFVNYLNFVNPKYRFLILMLFLISVFSVALKRISFTYNLIRAWPIKISISASASIFLLILIAHFLDFGIFNYNFNTTLSAFLLSDNAVLVSSAILFFALSLF